MSDEYEPNKVTPINRPERPVSDDSKESQERRRRNFQIIRDHFESNLITAERTKYSPGYVSMILRGERPVTRGMARKIEKRLQLRPYAIDLDEDQFRESWGRMPFGGPRQLFSRRAPNERDFAFSRVGEQADEEYEPVLTRRSLTHIAGSTQTPSEPPRGLFYPQVRALGMATRLILIDSKLIEDMDMSYQRFPPGDVLLVSKNEDPVLQQETLFCLNEGSADAEFDMKHPTFIARVVSHTDDAWIATLPDTGKRKIISRHNFTAYPVIGLLSGVLLRKFDPELIEKSADDTPDTPD